MCRTSGTTGNRNNPFIETLPDIRQGFSFHFSLPVEMIRAADGALAFGRIVWYTDEKRTMEVAMTRFFVSPEELREDRITLTGENAQHAKVLRLKNGEEVLVCDGQG